MKVCRARVNGRELLCSLRIFRAQCFQLFPHVVRFLFALGHFGNFLRLAIRALARLVCLSAPALRWLVTLGRLRRVCLGSAPALAKLAIIGAGMLALVKGHRSLRRSLALRFLRGVWCILRDVQICHGWLVSALHKLAVRILRCHFDCDGFLRAARKHVLERAVTVFRDDSRARGEARAHRFHVAFIVAECVRRWQ